MTDIAVLNIGITCDSKPTIDGLEAVSAAAAGAATAARNFQSATQRLYDDMAKMVQQYAQMAKEIGYVATATAALSSAFTSLSDTAKKSMDDISGYITQLYQKISQINIGKTFSEGFEQAEKVVTSLASKIGNMISSMSNAGMAGFNVGKGVLQGPSISEADFLKNFETMGEKISFKLGAAIGSAFELDGAANGKVEDIQRLIDGANWAPSELKKKFYLIDFLVKNTS